MEKRKMRENGNYWRFGAMVATSMMVMFGLMYLDTCEWGHARWSETRFYMTFVMGAAMAVIMPGFMLGMYKKSKLNIAIFAGSALVFAFALFLVRSRQPFRTNPG